MASTEELERRIALLEHKLDVLMEDRVGRLEDIEAIKRLQRSYGYYLDALLYDEMTELFADEGASIEIGQRGRYVGKENIRRFLHEVLGTGKPGLAKNQIINHSQHQAVVTVAPDRTRALGRFRAFIQASAPPPGGDSATASVGAGAMMWSEGVYENSYVKEDGVWKIATMWWSPTFYVTHPYDNLWFGSTPASDAFPPEAPSHPPLDALGRVFVDYHYLHPITGEAARAPTSDS